MMPTRSSDLPRCPELDSELTKWGLSEQGYVLSAQQTIELITRNFGITSEMDISNINVENITDDVIQRVKSLVNNYKKNHDITIIPPEYVVLLEHLYYSKKTLMDLNRLVICRHPGYQTADNTDAQLYRFSTMTSDCIDSLNPIQKLLVYYYEVLFWHEIKRYQGDCWEQIKTDDGYKTHAWKRKQSVSEFMNENVDIELNFELWKLKNSSGAVEVKVEKELRTGVQFLFPEIKFNRNVFSFKNGILHTKYTDVPEDEIDENTRYEVKFFPYVGGDVLDNKIAAAKYFDETLEYDIDKDWKNIETPTLDIILNTQFTSQDVKDWMYIFLGRLLYEVGEIDNWQVVPYLKGVAGSGKSTIVTSVVKRFYNQTDIGVLSNNIEKKFGLSMIADRFIFIAPEIKSDFEMDQAELQSVISGEDVALARKNQVAINIKWSTPGIFAGNRIPNWEDNAGSMRRRIVFFQFSKTPKTKDLTLERKLEKEIPMILWKSAMAYLEMAQSNPGIDVWELLPKQFIDERDDAVETINSLISFLKSDSVILGKGNFCEWSVFTKELRMFCHRMGFKNPSNLGKDYYQGPFNELDIEYNPKKVPDDLPEHLKCKTRTSWIKGFEIKKDDDLYSF